MEQHGIIVVAKSILILVLAVGLGACASTTSDPSTEQNHAEASEQPKKRCYREKETGTRLGKRICVTADD